MQLLIFLSEMSHRSAEFLEIVNEAKDCLKRVL